MEQREVDNMLLSMIQKHFPSLPLSDEHTDWGKWLGFARAVYEAGRASPASVPEGWKLVPAEPTKEMIGQACKDHGYPGGDRSVYARGYRSMLAAAPTPPVSEDRKDAELLDYIQNHGATIQIVPMANRTFGFEVGGLHKSRKLSVREAIDAAIQEDKL